MDEPQAKGFWATLDTWPKRLATIAGIIAGIGAVLGAVDRLGVSLPHWPFGAGRDRGDELAAAKQATGCDASGLKAANGSEQGNVLASAAGGRLVMQGSANWDKMIDSDEVRAVQIGEEVADFGVYAFRGGRAARLTAFRVLVPAANPMNPVAIDLLYTAGRADGGYTAIGTLPVIDAKVEPDGWQELRFKPVVACFLKVQLKESRSGNQYVMAHEFEAIGTVAGS